MTEGTLAGMAGADSADGLAPLKLEKLVARLSEISSLPHVALRVIEIAKDPEAGAGDLKEAVESDPALSARVLRMVNSAAYGVTTKVQNLLNAISFLGFTQVRNLALTASVSDIFKQDETIGTYRRGDLWRHLVSVGVCARLVARRCALPNFEDAFLAGLLHDIGIIMLDQLAHEHFCLVIDALDDQHPLTEVERALTGVTHCILGEAIAEQWRFPPSVRAAIRHHHDAHRYKGEGAAIVQCVEIANTLCTLKGITSVGRKLVRPPLEALKERGFKRDDLLVLARDLDGEIAKNESLFEV